MSESLSTMHPEEDIDLSSICVEISMKQYAFLEILSIILEGITRLNTFYVSHFCAFISQDITTV